MGLFSQKRHAGININDRSIEFVVINDIDHPAEIITHARIELPENCIVRGSVLNEVAVRNALKQVLAQAGLANEHVRATVSVSEYLIFPFSLSLTDVPREQWYERIKNGANERVPLHPDEQTQLVIKESLRLDRVVVYVLNRHIMQYYQEILAKEHIDVDFVEPESVAAARFLLPAFHDQELTLVCDIGKNSTQLLSLSRGMPVHSEVITVGADMLAQGTSLNAHAIAEFSRELAERISRMHIDTPPLLHLIGGGSLFAPLSEELEKHGLLIAAGILGTPLSHPKLKKNELRLYAHAIGSALRGTSGVGGNELLDASMIHAKRSAVLSLVQFKNRFALLATIAGALVLALVILIFVTQREPKVSQNQNANTAIPAQSSLDVFTLDLSEKNSESFLRKEEVREESITVATSSRNDAGESIVGENDVTQSANILKGKLRDELQHFFENQSSPDSRVVFASNTTKFEVTALPPTGEKSESATITVRATGYAFAIPEQALRSFASDHLGTYTSISKIEIRVPDYNPETSTGTAYIQTTYVR